ncbi:hypothetical protein OHU10_02290 [Streptomyces europaeiscabiei]
MQGVQARGGPRERDECKQVVAAVSVAAPACRVHPEAETEIAQKVLTTAGDISDRMAVAAG